LYDAIKRGVTQALAQYDLISEVRLDTFLLGDAVGSTDSYAGRLLKEKKLPWELSTEITTDQSTITQLHNLYILVVVDRGFFLIDQHAAHERILFEQLFAEFASEKKKHAIFHFPKPSVFDLSTSESELLLEQLPRFHSLGWEIEHFKDHSFILRSSPVLFKDRDHIKLLHEMLEDLRGDHLQKAVDSISERMIAYIACRMAIKAGDYLSKKQLTELVEQLERIPHNVTCPHGRPTKIWVDLERIDKLFKR
jgi:DNA mismatch repair protein MutL